MLFLPLHLRSECEQNCWDPKDGELCLNRVKPGTWRNTAWAWGIGGLGGTSGNIVLEEHSVNRGHCWKSSQSWKSVKHEELIKRIPCWDHKSIMPNTNCTSIQVFVERMNEGIDGLFHWRPWRLRWLDAWQMCLNNLYVLYEQPVCVVQQVWSIKLSCFCWNTSCSWNTRCPSTKPICKPQSSWSPSPAQDEMYSVMTNCNV